MFTKFEAAIGFVLPYDPILKKQGTERGAIV